MPSQDRIEAQSLYANILEEVKIRVQSINHCTLGLSGLAPPFVKEFCYLQIRLICELIAIGCLVAHGDLKFAKSNRLIGEWSAERIMNTLEKIHPQFYPQPIRQTRTADGIHIQAITTPLPKTAFLRLYSKCGDILHRGSAKKLMRGQFPIQVNYPDITAKVQPIVDLLSNHVLVMHTGEQMFLAMLHNQNDNGKTQVAIAETPKGLPMDFTAPDFLRGLPGS